MNYSKICINEAYAGYIEYLENEGLSDRHIETVSSRLHVFIYPTSDYPDDLRDMPVNKVVFRDIHQFFRTMRKCGRAEATLASQRSTQISFWNWCIKQGYRENNPAAKLKRWSSDPVVRRAAPAADVEMVLSSVEVYAAHRRYQPLDVRDALLVSFLGDNAGRLGEALDVRMAALKTALNSPKPLEDGGVCYHLPGFGKTGSTDLVFFDTTARLGHRWIQFGYKSEFVFCNLKDSTRLTNSGASKSFTRICNWAGVPIFWSHALRKRNITDIIRMSGDWKVGQVYAGHSDITTTMKHYNDFERDRVDSQAYNLSNKRRNLNTSAEITELERLFKIR